MDRITKLLLAAITVLLAIITFHSCTVGHEAVAQMSPPNQIGRYQFIKQNENNAFILDTSTGNSWRTFVESNGGPGGWSLSQLPTPEPPSPSPAP